MESRQGILQDVASQVNLVLGEYTRGQTDLTARVPGGAIGAERRCYGNAWHFEHARHNLVVKPSAIAGGLEAVAKAGVTYTAAALLRVRLRRGPTRALRPHADRGRACKRDLVRQAR